MKRRVVQFCLGIVLFACGTITSQAEPWSEKLGFPPGQRVIILDVRELGMGWEMNDAGTQLLEQSAASSADVVAIGPWFDDIATWCQQHPHHDIGLSIALTNPYPALSCRLLSSELGPTTLVDADGFPWRNVIQLAVSADPEDVKRELDAQIARARAKGVKISHLSGFHGTFFCRHDLASVLLAASQKYWLPAPVVELTPELIARFRQEGYPVDEEMIALINNYPMPKLDDLLMIPHGNSYEEARDYFCQLLMLLRPGLTEIICHPAVDSAGLRRLSADWQHRGWSLKMLSDPKVRQTLADQQIVVTNWREIMLRFEQGGVSRGDASGKPPVPADELEQSPPADVLTPDLPSVDE